MKVWDSVLTIFKTFINFWNETLKLTLAEIRGIKY